MRFQRSAMNGAHVLVVEPLVNVSTVLTCWNRSKMFIGAWECQLWVMNIMCAGCLSCKEARRRARSGLLLRTPSGRGDILLELTVSIYCDATAPRPRCWRLHVWNQAKSVPPVLLAAPRWWFMGRLPTMKCDGYLCGDSTSALTTEIGLSRPDVP